MIQPRKILPAPFVVGVSRSGTTLLRVMLDSHPDLAIPSETHFLNRIVRATKPLSRETFISLCVTTASWPNLNISPAELDAELPRGPMFAVPDALRRIYEVLAHRDGKRRWGDKTPSYLALMQQIQDLLPEASFIHVIRDGRDVALSLRDLWWGPGDDSAAAARFWVEEILHARAISGHVGRYLEVRYEDLVISPMVVLQRICAHIEIPFDTAMLSYTANAARRLEEVVQPFGPNGADQLPLERFRSIYTNTTKPLDPSKVSGWKATMTEAERRRFEEIAGPMLASLGYETL